MLKRVFKISSLICFIIFGTYLCGGTVSATGKGKGTMERISEGVTEKFGRSGLVSPQQARDAHESRYPPQRSSGGSSGGSSGTNAKGK